jgi:O-antigen ligase
MLYPTLLLLGTAILLGGGRGGIGDICVQLLAVATLLSVALSRSSSAGSIPMPMRVIVALTLVLPLLHWLPLPVQGMYMGVLRDQVQVDLQLAGSQTGVGIGLDRAAAERALWSLLPALAMVVAVSRLGHAQRRVLLAGLLGFSIVSILLGLAQLADGQQSLLRLHSPTNISDAVGFFANRNHFASLLAVSLPFAVGAAVWTSQQLRRGHVGDTVLLVALIGAALLLILGIVLARSRAGLLLAMLGMLMCLPMLWRLRQGGRRGAVLLLAAVVAVALMAQSGLLGMLQRLQTDPLDDGRWEYAHVVSVAAKATAPLGSGLGSFGQVYPQFEAETGAGPDYAVVNHAHNDVLELWLEAGWPLALVSVAFLCVLGWIGLCLWRNSAALSVQSLLLARLSWVAALLLVLHSCLDYPLRTTALMTVFAMLLAISVPASSRR